MIKVHISKMFHRDTIALHAGESFEETMRFVDFDAADDWATEINKLHANLPYHITGIHLLDADGRYASTFTMFDISEIWDTYDVQSRDVCYWYAGAPLINKKLAELRKTLYHAQKRGDDAYDAYCAILREQIDTTLATSVEAA